MTNQPPKYAENFFHWFCHLTHLEGLEGDLYELFELRVEEEGIAKARFKYMFDIVTLLRPSVSKSMFNSQSSSFMNIGIIVNYLKTSMRMGRKRAWFSAINLIGLTMGITSLLFIMLFISDELKYDTHITNVDQKYRLFNERHGEDGEINYLPIVPPVFAPALKDNFQQIEKVGRVMFDYGGTTFNIGDKAFLEKKGIYAEPEVLEILDIRLISGDLSRFDEPKSVLLSEDMFVKFFGDVPFNNQMVKLTVSELQVLGVFKNLPEQSHLEVDYIYPFEFAVRSVSEERMNSWIWQQFYTYVQLQEGINIDEFQTQVQEFISKESKPKIGDSGFYYITYFQSLKDIHLHSSTFEWDIAKRGNYQSILFLTIAAFIILIIACLNFINLTTAQALNRAKEVCVRKFVGARRTQLLLQYGIEATLYSFIAGLISSILLILLLPFFNQFAGKTIELSSVFSLANLGLFVSFLFVLGMVSGTYPALLITSFKPLMAVKGVTSLSYGKGASRVKIDTRQTLVAVQYVLSIGLILISLIIQKQYNFLQNTDMGFSKENLVVIPITRNMRKDPEQIRQTFTSLSRVSDAALSYGIPGGIVAGDGIYLPEKSDRERSCNMFMADEFYISTMGMNMVAGRNFNVEMATDKNEAFIINETAVRNFGLGTPEEAIGETVHWTIWGTKDSLKVGKVIGVVKDFNFKSLHNEMSSVVIHMGSNYFQNLIVRLEPGDIHTAISQLEDAYHSFEPNRLFEFSFIDETFRKFYESEQRLSWLFSLFTALAIITSGIGIFGLISFTIISRSREISIRKVLGAGVRSVIQLLVTRYVLMVLVCVTIAVPIAYYMANQWLQNFSFRVPMDSWIFVEVVVITLVFTAATVGIQAYRGAIANPSQKLRSE